MNKVYVHSILTSLDELADYEYQRDVWVLETRDVFSSFAECVCRLFDDSVLGHALDTYDVVFNPQVDALLRELDEALSRVDDSRPLAEVVDDPEFEVIRPLARRAAQVIRAMAPPEETPDPGA
jgi:hypothetical protein